uniref:Hypotheticial protein n=1 Tax=Schistosoma japonicum TaxID=6182 RepID=C1LY52_SCHJA|nr:hypotheticial protein [Schistosoma japonicum]
MLMKVIVMLCFVQYMICQEVTEMMTSESSNITADQSSNSTDNAGDVGSDDDVIDDKDDDYMNLLQKTLAVILAYLGNLLSITIIINPNANETMTN